MLLLCLIALCGSVGAAPPARQTLVVAAYPAMDQIVRAAIPLWKRTHPGVDIRVLSRGFEEHHAVMATTLTAATNLPDVMVVEVEYLGRFAATQQLLDLSQPPFLAKGLQALFAPFALAQATTASGAVVALPADIGPGTLLYRSDLLQRSGVSEEEMTKSWDSYLAAGVKIKAATGASLLPLAHDLVEAVTRSGVAPGEGQYFDASGAVLVESQRFRLAFEMAQQMRQQDLDARQPSWGGGWLDGLRKGSIATLMTGSWMAGHLATWAAPQTRGKWRAAQLPGHAWTTWGGTFYTIPRKARNQALAWEFVQFMALNRDLQISAFRSQNAFPALLKTYDDPFFDLPIDFLGGQRARPLWREAVGRVPQVGVHALDMEARIVVANELTKVLDNGKPIAQALHDARLTLERLLRSKAN